MAQLPPQCSQPSSHSLSVPSRVQTYSGKVVDHMWENFGGEKFWRINVSKAFGGENFGRSASSLSKKSYT